MSRDWKWVAVEAIMAGHAEQLAEHGGLSGIRDEGMLRSAMARPQNLLAYGDPDAAALAAAYAFGIARNHPFADGNKRVALLASEGFLFLNGYDVDATNGEMVALIYSLAAGEIDEEDVSSWFRDRLAAR